MRKFSARETEWLKELDGIELATFRQRAIAYVVDWIIIGIVLSMLATAVAAGVVAYLHHEGRLTGDVSNMVNAKEVGDGFHINVVEVPSKNSGTKTYVLDPHSKAGEAMKIFSDIVVPVLYFGILLWRGKGQTPGKRLMKIRVVSIMHRHITFWHSVERALGYGAAALEAGFGFVQFFIHPYRRCAQDRLAETIVVTESSYKALQHRLSHPLIPDTE